MRYLTLLLVFVLMACFASDSEAGIFRRGCRGNRCGVRSNSQANRPIFRLLPTVRGNCSNGRCAL